MTSGQAWEVNVGQAYTSNGLKRWRGGKKAQRLTEGLTIRPQVLRRTLDQDLVRAIHLLGSNLAKTRDRRRRDPLLCPFSQMTLESHNQRPRVYLSNIFQNVTLSSNRLLRSVVPIHSYKCVLDG